MITPATLTATAKFTNLVTGTYYVYVTKPGMIETWSKEGGQVVTTGSPFSYDFTTAQTQAYGGNMMLKNGLWCFYVGDIDGNGFIDNNDLLSVDNDAFNFAGGSLVTDLDGNQFVDNNDLLLCDNNAFNFVGTISPRLVKRFVKPVPVQKLVPVKKEVTIKAD